VTIGKNFHPPETGFFFRQKNDISDCVGTFQIGNNKILKDEQDS